MKFFEIKIDRRVHACYEPIRRAAVSGSAWVFLTVWAPEFWACGRKLSFPGLRQLTHIGTHMILGRRILFSDDRFIFVREFVTWPLLLAVPLWWWKRRRVIFLTNHNYQFAIRSVAQRFALISLLRCGAKLAALELSVHSRIRVPPNVHNIIVPFPIGAWTGGGRAGRGSAAGKKRFRVGVLTSFRREQRAEELITCLAQAVAARADWEIVVASHYHGPLRAVEAQVAAVHALTNDEDYWSTLAGFDVAVFYYERESYEYRTSGIVADAIACGTPVICPNYPVMARQVNWPEPMGKVYETLAELPALIAEISAWPVAEIERARQRHQWCRGQEAYVSMLEALRTGDEGDLCKAISTSETL
jgi:glycosyltransferase involved in cell wall biosynthesis